MWVKTKVVSVITIHNEDNLTDILNVMMKQLDGGAVDEVIFELNNYKYKFTRTEVNE